jgi:hypothetical protein
VKAQEKEKAIGLDINEAKLSGSFFGCRFFASDNNFREIF